MTRRLSPESPLICIERSKIHGRGVMALCNIAKGTDIIEYTGEKILTKEGDRRHQLQEKKGVFYVFKLNTRWDLDGSTGGDAKLINHSCNPNCEYKITRCKIWIRALRNIRKGEELTYNYFVTEQGRNPCKCGAKNCKGAM